ncbi:MAG TPA: MdtA/MuxA family multidrug efflux RND transporter periplasmic adaptor subunit, partial [Terriglobales bacterium]|nr:MdtA/MuxA family multidrug efflux RND transporter periplasmic adaptor subunit [Terriglobales bacterium]
MIEIPKAQACGPMDVMDISASITRASYVDVFRRRCLLAACLLLSFLYVGCSGASSKSASSRPTGPQTMPVGVATAQSRDMPYYLTGLGSVTAFYTVNIKSRVDGQLEDVKFKEGQNVKQGELLAVIDPRPYEVQLSQAQATLYKDQASLRDAKTILERYKALFKESGAVSQQQIDTQQATADELEGTVRNDQATIDNAKLQITYCHITAPVTGRIGLRQVDPGNIVHATDANPLFVITQLQPITVLFTLPEDQLPSVSQRMKQGPLTVDAYNRDDETKLATGKLLTIDNEIDLTTGTGKLKAVFNNTDNNLWPNQFVNIRLLLEVRKNSTVIPAAAIQRGPQGTYVFVANKNNTVDVRPVTVAFTQQNLANIATGLSPGEVVVTDGQDKLQAGSKIQPREQNTSGSGTQNAQAGTDQT